MALNAESDDKTLLLKIQEGNHYAFNLLVDRHHKRFYNVAYRLLNKREDAEDVVQDAFLKLWERPDLWDSRKNNKFTTWFYRIVVNLCYDRNKKKKPMPLTEGYDAPDERASQQEQLEQAERRDVINDKIAALPERQRQALVLCFFEELSNEEAARAMNVSTRALQSLIMRAKDNLKKELNL